jgi:hypothetical protein|tara:strand:- start:1268 stop:2011 length:744 start_codon:yes stop_codon:yes gene_type:complete
MATSGTNNFESTFVIDEVFQEAYDRVGIKEISGYHLTSARRSLNIMLQEWANRGLHHWEIADTSIDLVEGQAEYKFFRTSTDGTSATTLPTDGLYGFEDILEATYRTDRTTTSQSDSAMNKINRSIYSALANKLSTGTPNQYYVRKFADYVSVTFYPTPDATAASENAHIYYVKRIQDAGAYTNSIDVPYQFVPCMVSGLAYYLSQKYNPQLVQQTKVLYEEELQRALIEDGSSTSTFITPAVNYYG